MYRKPNLLVGAILVSMALVAYSQDADSVERPPKPAATPKADADLSVEQARLADRFKRLEEVIGRLAELSAAADPRRAELLRQAIAQSRQQELNTRFEAIVKLLEVERLSAAATNQTELEKELDILLNLLLKADRDAELASERDRLREYIKELGRLLRLERDLRARTEGGDDVKRLAQAQKGVADDTGKLGGRISDTEVENTGDKQGNDQKSTANDQKDSATGKSGDGKSDGKTPPDGSKESKAGKGQAGKGDSNDGKSSEGKSSEGKSSEGKSSEGKSSDDKSKSGAPGEGNSQKGEPADGKSGDGKSGKGQPGQPSTPGGQSDAAPGGEKSDPSQQSAPPPSPTERAVERLRRAQQQMEGALKELERAAREGATEQQQQAIESLEVAKAELERVLRQLREEEMERTLTQLAARFRKMLEMQTAIYEGTLRIDQVAATERTHDHEIESARLSRQEATLVREAGKALLLLREEGSSVAFPETVEQIRDDMQQVTNRLAAVDVGQVTQDLETDIIAALEESIAALEKALKDLEQNRTPRGQMPMAGQPADPDLVDRLAELKLIRSLQMRINVRTQRFGQMIAGEHADAPNLWQALEQLAKRQERVYQATADLSKGRND
jgi:hypothetical protein